ncbi:MAG: DUF5781 family protein [Haloferacaceae archaeon]
MDIRVLGNGPADPFLSAAELLATEYDVERPVHVRVRNDPDERTWAGHYEDRHVLNISRQASTSAMARELALHELAHMVRYEESHPSHTFSTEEALFLALAGRTVERRKISHCYQIANHLRDIYADDITIDVAPADKLVDFFESQLAAALSDRPAAPPRPDSVRTSSAADPDITAVNAAFALAMVERHDLVDGDHRLYDLAHAAANDAPEVAFDSFRRQFRSLVDDPTESDVRKALVDATREYCVDAGSTAAD